MAVTSWKAPQTAATAESMFGTDWSQPNYAKTDDENAATCAIPNSKFSYYLRLTNFDFSAIPDGSTIDGIEVQIKKKSSPQDEISIYDQFIFLRKTSGEVGDNKASAVVWPNIKETKTYGGASDTWNAGLICSDVKSADFGIDIEAHNVNSVDTRTAYVYFCQTRIYYTAPAVGRSFGCIIG